MQTPISAGLYIPLSVVTDDDTAVGLTNERMRTRSTAEPAHTAADWTRTRTVKDAPDAHAPFTA
jgi:hypothetical protein